MNTVVTTHSTTSFHKVAFAVLFFLSLCAVAKSAALTWDTTIAANATITEGSGTWTTGSGGWNSGATSVGVNWANSDTPTFGGGTAGTAGTVTLGSNITTGNIVFAVPSAGNYIIDTSTFTLNLSSGGGIVLTVASGAGPVTIQSGSGGSVALNSNSLLSVTGANALTVSAPITGAFNLQKNGAGDLYLTNNNNSFSGTFTTTNAQSTYASSIKNTGVNSSVGSGGQLSINSNGSLQYTGNGDSTNRTLSVGGGGANTSSLYSQGTGALIFTGTFTNVTTGAKDFRLRGTNTELNEIQGNIGDNGANVLTLTKNDAGLWKISGTNSYTGTTTISGGTLLFGKEVSLYNNTIASWTAANLIINSGTTAAFNVGGTGEFTSADLNTLLALGTAGGGFKNGSFVGLDTTNASSGNFTYATAITNTNAGANVLGLTKRGTNTLTLTGTNTATGLLTASEGTTVIGTASGGSWAGSVLANSGATLKGRGTIGGNLTISSGATYAPGNSPGIQSIVGNLTLASGSRTEIEIDGATAGNGAGFHDQINVTGTVTIQGGTIAPMTVFSGSSGYIPSVGQRFAAITGSSISGTFTSIDNSGNPAWVSFIPEYTGTIVYMRTTASGFANNPLLALSKNESSVGAALDSFRPSTIITGGSATDKDRIYNALTLLDTKGVKSAISQMSPEKLSAMTHLSQGMGSQINHQVFNQIDLRHNLNPAQGGLSIYNRNGQTLYEPVAGTISEGMFVKRKSDKLSFFAQIQGEQGEVKPSEQRTDFDYWSASAIYGGNYALSDQWNFGLFTAYGHTDTNLGGAGGNIFYDAGKVGGYVSWNYDDCFIEAIGSAGKGYYETKRTISFLSEEARGKTEGVEGMGELRMGKDLNWGFWTLSPTIFGRYSRTFIDSYEETGSAARLDMRPMDGSSLVSGSGIKLQRTIHLGTTSLIPRLFTNYEREWDRSGTINARFAAGGSRFSVESDPIDADQLTAGTGVAWVVSDRLQWDLSYEREVLQNDLQRQSINLSCKFTF